MQMKKPLREEIKDFQKEKNKLMPILIALGLLGLLFPILPGLALLFFAFLLVFPRQGEIFIQRIRKFFGLQNEI